MCENGDHKEFKLATKKCAKRRRTYIIKNDEIIKEIGPANKNWFKDASQDRLTRRLSFSQQSNSSTPIHAKTTRPEFRAKTSSTSDSESFMPASLQHLLNSQTPSPIHTEWKPPFMSALATSSPCLDSFLDIDKHSDKKVSAIEKLTEKCDDSLMSWTSSLATPTSQQPGTVFKGSPEQICNIKGLPRVLFSPGTQCTDDELVCVRELSSEENTDDEKKQGININRHSNGGTSKASLLDKPCVKEEFKSRSNVNVKNNNEPDLKFTISPKCLDQNDIEINASGRGERTMEMSKLGLSTDRLNTVVSSATKDSHSKEDDAKSISRKENAVVDIILSDFFDTPSDAVGRRKCAPSRGKKRKLLEEELEEGSSSSQDFSKSITTLRKKKRKTNQTNSSPNISEQAIFSSDKQKGLEYSVNDIQQKRSTEFMNDDICETATGSQDLKSILSTEKKKRHRKNMKHVTFSVKTPSFSKEKKIKALKKDLRRLHQEIAEKENEFLQLKSETERQYCDNQEKNTLDDSECLGTSDYDESLFEQWSQDSESVFKKTKISEGSLPTKKRKLAYVEITDSDILSVKKEPSNDDVAITNTVKTISNSKTADSNNKFKTEDIEDELFSQVSPTVLDEMCSVASDYEKGTGESKEESLNQPTMIKKEDIDTINKDTGIQPMKKSCLKEMASCSSISRTVENASCPLQLGNRKKFMYPSAKQIAKSCPQIYSYNNLEKVSNIGEQDMVAEKLPDCAVVSKNKETDPLESNITLSCGTDPASESGIFSGDVNTSVSSHPVSKNVIDMDITFGPDDGFEELDLESLHTPSKPSGKVCITEDKVSHIAGDSSAVLSNALANKSIDCAGDSGFIGGNNFGLEGFKTASGNKCQVSEQAFSKAKNIIFEDSELDQITKNTQIRGKLLVSGSTDRPVSKIDSKKTKQRTVLGLNCGESTTDYEHTLNLGSPAVCRNTEMFGGFSTGHGKKIEVSERSLEKAYTLIETESNQDGSSSNKLDTQKNFGVPKNIPTLTINTGKGVEETLDTVSRMPCHDNESTENCEDGKLNQVPVNETDLLNTLVDLKQCKTTINKQRDKNNSKNCVSKNKSKSTTSIFGDIDLSDIETNGNAMFVKSGSKAFKPPGPTGALQSMNSLSSDGALSTNNTCIKVSKTLKCQTAANIFSDIDFSDLNLRTNVAGFQNACAGFNTSGKCSKDKSKDFVGKDHTPQEEIETQKTQVRVGVSKQTMKSATNAARFMSGNVPKGFRPFKPPKLLQKDAKSAEISPEKATSEEQVKVKEDTCTENKQDNLECSKDSDVYSKLLNEMFEEDLEPPPAHLNENKNVSKLCTADLQGHNQNDLQYRDDCLVKEPPSLLGGFKCASEGKMDISSDALLKAHILMENNANFGKNHYENDDVKVHIERGASEGQISCDVPFDSTLTSEKNDEVEELTNQTLSKKHDKESLWMEENINFSEIMNSQNEFSQHTTLTGIEICKVQPMKVQSNLSSKHETILQEPTENVLNSNASQHASCNLPEYKPFQSASGKKIGISEKALLQAKKTLDSVDEMPFQSASGKKVGVSEKALLQAKQTLDSVDEMPFQSASGKKIGVSENALLQAKKTLDSVDEMPFQSASGKKIGLSEKALLQAKQTLDSVDEMPFQSASGKKIGVSEKALLQGKKTLDSVDEMPFQSASGKKIGVSEKALVQAKKTLDSDEEMPFQSVSGKKIGVSEKTLVQAKKTLDSVEEMPFKSASGKKIGVSEKALVQAKKTLDSIDEMPFQSASGKKIGVSEKALVQAKKTLDSVEEMPFQSASGKKIGVSEKALLQAKKTLNSVDEMPFQSASGKKIGVSEKALLQGKKTLDSVDEMPFQSASGKKIGLSEKALVQAKKTLDSVEEIPFQSASGKRIGVSEKALLQAKKTLNSVDEMPFQSASGKKIGVSEKALVQAKKTLDSIDEMPFQGASGKKIGVSEKALVEAKKTLDSVDEMPFQSASEKNISVSEKALVQAKKTLDSVDEMPFQSAPGKKIGVSEQALVQAKKTLDSVDEMPFQSASGKKIGVSEKALVEAKKTLDSVDEMPFQSASGKKIGVSENALLQAKECMKNCNEKYPQNPQEHASQFPPYNTTFSVVPDQVISVMENSSTKIKPQEAQVCDDLKETSTVLKKISISEECLKDFLQELCDSKEFLEEMVYTPKKTIPVVQVQDRTVKEASACDFHSLKNSPEDIIQDRKFSSSMLKPVISSAEMKKSDRPRSEQVPVVTQPPVAKAVFKTPYKDKASAAHVYSSTDNTKSIVRPQPIFLPKGQNTKSMPKVSEEKSMQMSDLIDNNIDIDQCLLRKARLKQKDMISSKGTVKPIPGRLYLQKLQHNRLRLQDIIDRTLKLSLSQLKENDVCEDVIKIQSINAGQYKFNLSKFYSKISESVYVGDGALLVPDENLCAGWDEFYRAFLTLEGVDQKLISEEWFLNHYRWIIWKLASYEIRSPKMCAGRSLTPEMTMLQLKYRYDREVDKCQRSAIKKIVERDDAPSKRLVLCVSSINRLGTETIMTPQTNQTPNKVCDAAKTLMDCKIAVEVTDGWYAIQSSLDGPLTEHVRKGRIKVGDKIVTSGAELIGSQEACSPLEIPESLLLKMNSNTTRPATWTAKLGFQTDPRPLCVPLHSLHQEGGPVGCVDVVLARKYPCMFMEKLADGSCVFRSNQAENKYQLKIQKQKQDDMEKMFNKLQKELEVEEHSGNTKPKRTWNLKDIKTLQSGSEIYEAFCVAKNQESFQECLNESQREKLMEKRLIVMEEKQRKLQDEFKKNWQLSGERNVIPLMKMRIVDYSSKAQKKESNAMVTVWRPTSEVEELIEGQRYKIFGLNSSSSRSRYSNSVLQLTATRKTQFLKRNLPDGYSCCPRKVFSIQDLVFVKCVAFGEVDFAGIVIEVAPAQMNNSKSQDLVYAADINSDIICIKFWGGLKEFCLEETLCRGTTFCSGNLLLRKSFRAARIPVLEASSEYSVFTQTPLFGMQKSYFEALKSKAKAKDYLKNMNKTLEEFLTNKETMKKTEENLASRQSTEDICDDQVQSTRQKSDAESRIAKLMNYGTPAALSPIVCQNTKSVRKAFKPPKPNFSA